VHVAGFAISGNPGAPTYCVERVVSKSSLPSSQYPQGARSPYGVFDTSSLLDDPTTPFFPGLFN